MEIIIDGKKCEAKAGETILSVAQKNDIYIPTLCHFHALAGQGNCRICIVEVTERNRTKIVTSCIYPVTKPIKVVTNSETLFQMRRTLVMLISARIGHNEVISELRQQYDLPPITRFKPFDEDQCILCGLCVRACEEMGIYAISTVNRGIDKKVSTPFDQPSKVCVGCGACAQVCPTEAIKITDNDKLRIMWNKTFELLKCSKCGKPFITRECYEFLNAKINTTADEFMCEKCKRSIAAEKFKNVYGI